MNIAPPRLPDPPKEYTDSYMFDLIRTITLHFRALSATRALTGASLNLNINTLPTEASLTDLRSGDVYVDTTSGNVLKVKP